MNRCLVLFLLLSHLAFGQSGHAAFAKAEQGAAKQVEAANQKIREAVESTSAEDAFNEACRRNCNDVSPKVRQEARKAELHRLTLINQQVLHIERIVDEYVALTVDPNEVDSQRIASTIRRILGDSCLDGPFIFGPSHGDDLMILAYTLNQQRMGPTGTAVTIRAYQEISGRFQLVASAGREMNGDMRLSVQELHSPKEGEHWLIVSGYMTGANGPNNSMRVYAYDGARFRAVWSRNVWGTFAVEVINDGFRVTGEYYRTEKKRRDRYVIDENSVHLARK